MTSSNAFAEMINAVSEHAAVAVADDSNFLESLFPEEQAIVRRAVEKRRREFAVGRHCARRALAHFGVEPGPIGVEPSRAPRWPRGFVGSITHCEGFTAAVVARDTNLRSVGIDAELSTPLDSELIASVLTPAEVARVERTSVLAHGDWGKVVFSAKESVHKCLHPVTDVMLDFLDVELTIDPLERRFRVRGINPARTSSLLPDVEGCFATTPEFAFTAAVLRAGAD